MLRDMKKLGIIAVAGLLVLTGCSAEDSRLADAQEECSGKNGSGMRLADDGTTLIFDMKGEEDTSGGSEFNLACVLNELNTPERITTHMSQTTSLDGRQTAEWDDFEVSWSYHPKRGLDAVFVVTR